MAIIKGLDWLSVTLHDATHDDNPLPEHDPPSHLSAIEASTASTDNNSNIDSSNAATAITTSAVTPRDNEAAISAASTTIIITTTTPARPGLRPRKQRISSLTRTPTSTKYIETPSSPPSPPTSSTTNANKSNTVASTAAATTTGATGTPFRIRIAFKPGLQPHITGRDVQVRVAVDGVFVEDRLWREEELLDAEERGEWWCFIAGRSRVNVNTLNRGGDGGSSSTGGGSEGGGWAEEGFVFRPLQVVAGGGGGVSGGNDGIDEGEGVGLGCVRVLLFKGWIGAAGEAEDARWARVKGVERVSEAAAKGKAVSHGVGVAPQRTVEPRDVREFMLEDDEPFAAFEFYYRSLERLKELGVVERSPAPLPLAEKEFDTLTEEEVKRLAREHHIQLKLKADEARLLDTIKQDSKDSIRDIIDDEVIFIERFSGNAKKSGARRAPNRTIPATKLDTSTSEVKEDSDGEVIFIRESKIASQAGAARTLDVSTNKIIQPNPRISAAAATQITTSGSHIATEGLPVSFTDSQPAEYLATVQPKAAKRRQRSALNEKDQAKKTVPGKATKKQAPKARPPSSNKSQKSSGTAPKVVATTTKPLGGPYYDAAVEETEEYPIESLLLWMDGDQRR